MKTWRGFVMGMFAAAELTFAARAGDAQTIHVGKDNRLLEVSGVGTASAEPEIAKVHVGFIAYGVSLKDGYKKASELSGAIVKALHAAGASKSDVESQGQGIAELKEYELKGLSPSLKGMRYRLMQDWTVRVAIAQIAKMLDAAVQAGANDSGQVEWLMKDSTALERQAVSRATARTRALADEMAAGMGVKLGPLVYVTTQAEPSVAPLARAMPRSSTFQDVSEAAPLEIGAQRIERSVTVKAVYSIE